MMMITKKGKNEKYKKEENICYKNNEYNQISSISS